MLEESAGVTEEQAAGSVAQTESPTVVTKDQVEAKNRETQAAWSGLMDQMETSRATQGEYFISLGEKTEEEDRRAFVLIQRNKDFGGKVVVITPDGPKIGDTKSGIDPFDNVINAVGNKDWENVNEGTGFIKGTESQPDKVSVNIKALKSGDPDLKYEATVIPMDDEEILNAAIERSVAKAEAPHKRNIESAQKRIDLASSLSAKIGALPPKV